MKKHLLLWFRSLGGAYSAADLATRNGARILELFPFGSKAQLFLEVTSTFSSEKFLSSLNENPEKSALLSLGEPVLKAYLSLASPPLGENLMIVEAVFLGDIFSVAQSAVEKDLSILDLRFSRDSQASSYTMLTGSTENCQGLLKKLPPTCAGRFISKPSDSLREFFPRPQN